MGKWKPKKISREEYNALFTALERKGRDLLRALEQIGRLGYWTSPFFSSYGRVCSYDSGKVPKSYHIDDKPLVEELHHFLNFPCDCEERARMRNKEEAICLCRTLEGDGFNCYLTTHKIGLCPWKTRRE